MGYTQPTAISMDNEAKKSARGEAAVSKSYSCPQDWPDPLLSSTTKELPGLYIESWDRVCPTEVKVMEHEGQRDSGQLSSQGPLVGFELCI